MHVNILWSMSEFAGLWKQQNKPARRNSARAFKLKLDTNQHKKKRKKKEQEEHRKTV